MRKREKKTAATKNSSDENVRQISSFRPSRRCRFRCRTFSFFLLLAPQAFTEQVQTSAKAGEG
jgi:hypothetical protein